MTHIKIILNTYGKQQNLNKMIKENINMDKKDKTLTAGQIVRQSEREVVS